VGRGISKNPCWRDKKANKKEEFLSERRSTEVKPRRSAGGGVAKKQKMLQKRGVEEEGKNGKGGDLKTGIESGHRQGQGTFWRSRQERQKIEKRKAQAVKLTKTSE